MNRISFWRGRPRRASFLFFAGVFLLFAVIGIANDIAQMGRTPVLTAVLVTVITALFAIGYAVVGFALRKNAWKAVVPLFILNFIVVNAIAALIPSVPASAAMGAPQLARLHNRMIFDAIAAGACVMLGYICFLYVTVTEGRRYLRARAEIELAAEVHRLLVPEIETKMDGFEFYGRSSPSAEVGGDLIDVAGSSGNWVAYLADVSGHGVGPGVVMAMVKSSSRMLLSSGEDSEHLLARLNEVLYPLKKPDMFITFCFLAKNGSELRVGLAGHPAILHFCADENAVRQLDSSNMPLGILPTQEFASCVVRARSGDVLALYTDGFLEVANAAGEEFGLVRFQQEFQKHAAAPLKCIYSALQESVARHGTQFDDQSLLLIRVTGPGT